ncbi:hypothetical protein C8R45DRAFT_1086260 [Mycena sanguinolenta]|nr:hypothetical protein C8R45DRAFT_1086260 [Mycena sanguinolenta]
MAYAAEQGSSQNLKRLVMMVPSMPVAQLRHLLPVLYANLDPATVPTTDELEDIVETADYDNSVQRAFLALDGLAKLLGQEAVPVDAYQTLWPRAWLWIHLTETYAEQFPESMPTRVGYGTYLSVIPSMLGDPPTAEVVSATSSVRYLLVRAWEKILDSDPPLFCWILSNITCAMSSFSNPEEPRCLAELIDGAGGTLRHLADLIVKHLTYLIPMASSTEVEKICVTGALCNLLSFIDDIFLATSDPEDIGPPLIAHGILTALICLLRALDLRVIVPQGLLGPYLAMLRRFVVAEPDPQRVVEALRAGLIDLIASLVGHPLEPDTAEDVCYLLKFLTSTMVYCSVLTEIERMSHTLDEILDQNDSVIMPSPVFDAWKTFTESVEERRKMKQLFDSDESPSFLVCDNTECNTVSQKSEFKRCVGCKYVSYCSRDCQKRDWKGGHREECQKRRLANSGVLVKQNRAFLRALVHHDSEIRREEVLEKQVEFEHRNPGTKFHTLFDYTERRVPIIILPLTEHEDMLEVVRMRRSQGNMELHTALVAREGGKQAFLFPMRSSSGANVSDGETLVRIHT